MATGVQQALPFLLLPPSQLFLPTSVGRKGPATTTTKCSGMRGICLTNWSTSLLPLPPSATKPKKGRGREQEGHYLPFSSPTLPAHFFIRAVATLFSLLFVFRSFSKIRHQNQLTSHFRRMIEKVKSVVMIAGGDGKIGSVFILFDSQKRAGNKRR